MLLISIYQMRKMSTWIKSKRQLKWMTTIASPKDAALLSNESCPSRLSPPARRHFILDAPLILSSIVISLTAHFRYCNVVSTKGTLENHIISWVNRWKTKLIHTPYTSKVIHFLNFLFFWGGRVAQFYHPLSYGIMFLCQSPNALFISSALYLDLVPFVHFKSWIIYTTHSDVTFPAICDHSKFSAFLGAHLLDYLEPNHNE